MAVDDLINATKSKLETMIAPIDGGAGADISFEEPFEKVKAEIEKLTSMSGGKVDWGTIASSCDELLSDKGKDFRAALYYATARSQMDGVAGLFDGFVLLSELIEGFWTTMGPPLKRPKARGNLCNWFAELITPTIIGYQPTDKDHDLIEGLEKVSRRVDSELADKLGDAYGGMSALRSAISNLVRALPPKIDKEKIERERKQKEEEERRKREEDDRRRREEEERRKREDEERRAQQQDQARYEPPPPAPTQVVQVVQGGGMSPDSIVDAESAANALMECSRLIQRAGTVLRSLDPSDANAYRLFCAGAWIEVQQAPPAESNATILPSPPPHYKDQLDGLASSGDWANLAGFAQDLVVESPLWLDPHRYAAQALGQLGYDNARLALLREVGYLLARASGLAELTFNDGTPFADPATKEWIEAEVKPVLGGGGGDGPARPRGISGKLEEARQMVVNGALPDAVQLIMKAAAATAAQSPAERFRGKLAIAQVCLAGEQFMIARAQLDGLDKMVEQHRLWEWEPELCTQFYAALYQAHRGMNALYGEMATPEQRARESAAFERLSQLDASAALKFTFGG